MNRSPQKQLKLFPQTMPYRPGDQRVHRGMFCDKTGRDRGQKLLQVMYIYAPSILRDGGRIVCSQDFNSGEPGDWVEFVVDANENYKHMLGATKLEPPCPVMHIYSIPTCYVPFCLVPSGMYLWTTLPGPRDKMKHKIWSPVLHLAYVSENDRATLGIEEGVMYEGWVAIANSPTWFQPENIDDRILHMCVENAETNMNLRGERRHTFRRADDLMHLMKKAPWYTGEVGVERNKSVPKDDINALGNGKSRSPDDDILTPVRETGSFVNRRAQAISGVPPVPSKPVADKPPSSQPSQPPKPSPTRVQAKPTQPKPKVSPKPAASSMDMSTVTAALPKLPSAFGTAPPPIPKPRTSAPATANQNGTLPALNPRTVFPGAAVPVSQPRTFSDTMPPVAKPMTVVPDAAPPVPKPRTTVPPPVPKPRTVFPAPVAKPPQGLCLPPAQQNGHVSSCESSEPPSPPPFAHEALLSVAGREKKESEQEVSMPAALRAALLRQAQEPKPSIVRQKGAETPSRFASAFRRRQQPAVPKLRRGFEKNGCASSDDDWVEEARRKQVKEMEQREKEERAVQEQAVQAAAAAPKLSLFGGSMRGTFGAADPVQQVEPAPLVKPMPREESCISVSGGGAFCPAPPTVAAPASIKSVLPSPAQHQQTLPSSVSPLRASCSPVPPPNARPHFIPQHEVDRMQRELMSFEARLLGGAEEEKEKEEEAAAGLSAFDTSGDSQDWNAPVIGLPRSRGPVSSALGMAETRRLIAAGAEVAVGGDEEHDGLVLMGAQRRGRRGNDEEEEQEEEEERLEQPHPVPFGQPPMGICNGFGVPAAPVVAVEPVPPRPSAPAVRRSRRGVWLPGERPDDYDPAARTNAAATAGQVPVQVHVPNSKQAAAVAAPSSPTPRTRVPVPQTLDEMERLLELPSAKLPALSALSQQLKLDIATHPRLRVKAGRICAEWMSSLLAEAEPVSDATTDDEAEWKEHAPLPPALARHYRARWEAPLEQ